jgi:hypothetical protein
MATGRQDRGDVPFPVRGVPGGWRDVWDDPDDAAALRSRVEAAEAHLLARVAITGRGVATGSHIVVRDGEGAVPHDRPPPDTRIATAPASAQFDTNRPQPRLT